MRSQTRHFQLLPDSPGCVESGGGNGMSPRARFLQSGSIIDGAILPFRHSLRADLSSGCNENRTADVKGELSFRDWLVDVLIRDDESIRFH